MTKFSDLMTLYIDIVSECSIGQLGPPFSYYYADDVQTNLLAKDVIEVDIKSAFPTICKLYFGEDHPFVKNIFALEDKLERNIYIATTLKQQADLDGSQYLNELNLWSKIFVLGYTYSKYKDISIIQYVKDGVIIQGKLKDTFTQNQHIFLNYIVDHNIIFHETPILYYIRFNKTSIIKTSNELKVKGKFRNLPKYIETELLPRFFNGEIYDSDLLYHIRDIYSRTYFEILKGGKLFMDIEYFYGLNENQYLNIQENFGGLGNICPKIYLIGIIYPILSLFRINQNSG